MVINSTSGKVEIALLEDGQLVELHRDSGDKRLVGDILGPSQKGIAQPQRGVCRCGARARCFCITWIWVRITEPAEVPQAGHARQAAGAGLGQLQERGRNRQEGKIKDEVSFSIGVGSSGQRAHQFEGASLDGRSNAAGRYIVLVPFSDKVSLSGRIKSEEERKRLKRLMQSIRPPGLASSSVRWPRTKARRLRRPRVW